MSKPPVIDGRIEASEWEGVVPVTGFIDPWTSKPTPDQTFAYLGYDDQAIYVAFDCRDSDPKGIVGVTRTAGGFFGDEDHVSFVIDPFSRSRSQWESFFNVNALGIQSESIAGGRASKTEWRGIWQGAAQRTETGWTAEMRIPWAVLDLPQSARASCQINFFRKQQRTKTISRWADITLQELEEKSGIWQDVEFPKQTAKPKVAGLAYIAPEYDDDSARKASLRSGVDFRYKPNGLITGLVSVNPDFRNIESQVESINFSRTERQLGESRPFFTEGSGFFRTTSGFGIGQLFYSRRIDDFDTGVKAFGNLTKDNSFGVLMTREDGKRTDGMFRFHHELDTRSDINVFGTSRTTAQQDNLALGTTGSIARGRWEGSWDWVHAQDRSWHRQAAASALAFGDGRYYAFARWQMTQPGFSPALGYVPETNKVGGFFYNEYDAVSKSGPLRNLNVNGSASQFRKMTGGLYERYGNFSLNGETFGDLGFSLSIDGGRTYDPYQDRSVADSIVSAGFTINNSKPHNRYFTNYSFGRRDGVTAREYGVGLTNRVLKSLDLSLTYNRRQDFMLISQSIATASWELTPTQSISARFVRTAGDMNAYLAYRRAGAKGIETYFILGDPNATKTRARIAVKFVIPF